MAVKTFSVSKNSVNQFEEIVKGQLSDFIPEFILCFYSNVHHLQDPCAKLKNLYTNCNVIGCTSHSEYNGGSLQYNSIVVAAFDKETIEDVHIEVIENATKCASLRENVSHIYNYFGSKNEMIYNFDKYVGIVLFDAACGIEEIFMDKLGMATELLYVGGTNSAVNDEDETNVCANGKSYSKAVVLATLKTKNGYDIKKIQSAKLFTQTPYTVTRSDFENRLVYELDGKLAADVYQKCLNITMESIESHYFTNPFGVIADNELFVRAIDTIYPDGSIKLFCGIPEGTQVHILTSGDIIQNAKDSLEDCAQCPPQAMINFNCMHRTFDIVENNVTDQYDEVFSRYNSIGFSSWGEAFLGHMNQTSTVLIVK